MAKFIQAQPTVTVLDPVTDAPVSAELQPVWTWERTWRTAVSALAMKGQHDALSLIDLRRKGSVPAGQWFELTEEEFKMIEPEFKRPDVRVFFITWIFSAESHQRAVLDAPSKMPVTVNGTTAEAFS